MVRRLSKHLTFAIVGLAGVVAGWTQPLPAERRLQPPANTAGESKAVNVPVSTAASAAQSNALRDTTVTLDKKKFDLAKSDDLNAFLQTVKDLRSLSADERKEDKQAKKEGAEPAAPVVEGMTGADKKADKAGKKLKGRVDWSDKKVRHGLKAMENIAKAMQKGTIDQATGIHDIQEIAWAVESNFLTPSTWRKTLDIGDVFFRLRAISLNACGRGSARNPAWDLVTYDAPDMSKVDPKPSTFWARPASIANEDLCYGWNRRSMPDFTDAICTYDKPHSGYGIHPSFEVTWHDTKWKVKFDQERSSEPFASRIWWALGYPAEIVDYTPEVKIRWDRRILSQFNSRRHNTMHVKFIGIPITTVHQNAYYDPFDYIQYAALKDGSRIEPQQLRDQLFPIAPGHSRPKHPELKDALYDTAFEGRIDYLVMKDAGISSKEAGDAQEVGFWDYNYLDHPKLREVRAMAVLDAWLDNWDIRWGNNRLELIEEKDGSYRLEHVVSDLGAAFGNSAGMLHTVSGRWKKGLYQNAPNDYEWACTHPQAAGKTSVPIRDYMPIAKTQPFYEMNLDDARWMARLIGQLTENQIKEALIGAGFDAAEARLLLEKLVARRDQMMKDFGLTGEIALLRPEGVNRRLSYDPAADGPFAVSLAPGVDLPRSASKDETGGPVAVSLGSMREIAARNSGEYVVVNGKLKPAREEKKK